MMHGREKSDSVIVAVKPANKAEQPAVERSAAEPTAAEPVEPRAETKGNAGQQSTCRAQSRVSVSQALERKRQAFAVWTGGKSRMRESCMYGSERGAVSNDRPYRTSMRVLRILTHKTFSLGCRSAVIRLNTGWRPADNRLCFLTSAFNARLDIRTQCEAGVERRRSQSRAA